MFSILLFYSTVCFHFAEQINDDDDDDMPAVDKATTEVLSTWSPVDQGHRLASCDTYIVGRILPRAIRSPSPWFYSARATKRALAVALYTITIDRVYDSKA